MRLFCPARKAATLALALATTAALGCRPQSSPGGAGEEVLWSRSTSPHGSGPASSWSSARRRRSPGSTRGGRTARWATAGTPCDGPSPSARAFASRATGTGDFSDGSNASPSSTSAVRRSGSASPSTATTSPPSSFGPAASAIPSSFRSNGATIASSSSFATRASPRARARIAAGWRSRFIASIFPSKAPRPSLVAPARLRASPPMRGDGFLPSLRGETVPVPWCVGDLEPPRRAGRRSSPRAPGPGGSERLRLCRFRGGGSLSRALRGGGRRLSMGNDASGRLVPAPHHPRSPGAGRVPARGALRAGARFETRSHAAPGRGPEHRSRDPRRRQCPSHGTLRVREKDHAGPRRARSRERRLRHCRDPGRVHDRFHWLGPHGTVPRATPERHVRRHAFATT